MVVRYKVKKSIKLRGVPLPVKLIIKGAAFRRFFFLILFLLLSLKFGGCCFCTRDRKRRVEHRHEQQDRDD